MRVRLLIPARLFVAALGMGIVTQSAPVAAQASRTVLDGVYTDEQATRGRELFATACASCHKEDLSGDRGPALAGEAFNTRFEADTVGRIFTTVSTRMPQDNPRSLKPEQYADLIAFLLQVNKFPSGMTPLPAVAEALMPIRIVRVGGAPTEAPNFALVHVVGCLTQAADNGWQVTSASAPVVTRNAGVSADVELQEAQAKALGMERFRLMFVTVQAATISGFRGNRVEAKGVLIRGAENRLNLTAMQSIGGPCAN